MREKVVNKIAESSAHEVATPEDIALTQPEVETINGGLEREMRRERSVAKQRLVWQNRQFIFHCALAGLLVSVLIAFLIPSRFQSSARLMHPDQGSSGMGMGMALLTAATTGSGGGVLGPSMGSVAGDLLGLKNSSDLFLGVLQSRTVQDDLINKFDLKKVYWDRRMEDAREDLGKHTSLSADRKSGIISIQVEDGNPKRAAAMAEEYVDALNQVVTHLNTSSAHRERVFLEERLAQVKQDLESAEKNFSEFASKNTALDVPTQGRAMIEAAATLEGQLIAAQTELEGLKQIYADGNIRVRSTQARVDELRRQLEKNLGGKDGNPGAATAQDRESLYPSIRELPALGVGWADRYRNTKIQEVVYQTLTQQYELAKVQEAKETPSVKILDAPNVPEKRSFPPRTLIVALGTMLTIAGSVWWVFGKHSWEQTSASDPQIIFAHEVIHSVRANLPWASTNGSGPSSIGSKVWGRLRQKQNQPESEK